MWLYCSIPINSSFWYVDVIYEHDKGTYGNFVYMIEWCVM